MDEELKSMLTTIVKEIHNIKNDMHKGFQDVDERFEKVDSFTQGVGLGLPICKSIAECMGGSIGLTSEVGVGTTVWVTLPCSTAPTPKLYKEKLIDNFYS